MNYRKSKSIISRKRRVSSLISVKLNRIYSYISKHVTKMIKEIIILLVQTPIQKKIGCDEKTISPPPPPSKKIMARP